MPKRYYDTPQLRYLKARLSMFQKPAFWRSAVFLLISIISWQYSSNLNFLSQKKDPISKPIVSANKPLLNISPEDQGIAADIDNLPVLLDNFQNAALSGRVIILQHESDPPKNNDFLQAVMQENSHEEEKSKNIVINNESSFHNTHNQFIVTADNLLRFSAENNKSQFLGINNISKSGDELTNINSNNLSQISHPNLVVPNNTIIQSSNYTVNNSANINTSNNTTNTNTNNNNLPTQTFVPNNNVQYIKPIESSINTQQTSISPNLYKINNNNTSLPINSPIPNNTAIPNSNIPGVTSNYSGYVMTPLNQSQTSNIVTPGY
jgi:hypothetical protein